MIEDSYKNINQEIERLTQKNIQKEEEIKVLTEEHKEEKKKLEEEV